MEKRIEQLAVDFFRLMPLIRNTTKPFEKTIKTLSPLQFHVLVFLSSRGSLSMSQLAAKLHISRQQLTSLTDKLEEKNFIERVHDKEDRRSVNISITPSGMHCLEEHRKRTIKIIARKFEQLSPEEMEELHGAIQSFTKIINRLQDIKI